MKALFLAAIATVAPVFIYQLKQQIGVWVEDYRARQRKERLRLERERNRG
jgi:hypothetical protein